MKEDTLKNQYFGDVSDYRKYGILRAISSDAGMRVGVCWMLTPDDGRTDGELTDYLGNPSSWRGYDPTLFDAIRDALGGDRQGARAVGTAKQIGARHVGTVRAQDLIAGAAYFDDIVPSDLEGRIEWFDRAAQHLRGAELVFFDPDNGLEVRSVPSGCRGSEKYVRWSEIEACYTNGQSVLVFQYYPRRQREAYHAELSAEARACTGAETIRILRTSRVAFLLLVQPRHQERLGAALHAVAERWTGQIEIVDS